MEYRDVWLLSSNCVFCEGINQRAYKVIVRGERSTRRERLFLLSEIINHVFKLILFSPSLFVFLVSCGTNVRAGSEESIRRRFGHDAVRIPQGDAQLLSVQAGQQGRPGRQEGSGRCNRDRSNAARPLLSARRPSGRPRHRLIGQPLRYNSNECCVFLHKKANSKRSLY